jgi:hypothetical protein
MSFGILSYPGLIPGTLIENPGGVVRLREEEAGEVSFLVSSGKTYEKKT